MSRVVIRPGIGRYITDTPAHLLNPETDWAYAQDALTSDGKLVQRKGWPYDGTTADVAANLHGVWRAKFVLANVTRTITSQASGVIYIHNAAGVGTVIHQGSTSTVPLIPRCVYNDELILCGTDGLTPLRRYSGSALTAASVDGGAPVIAAGESRITGGTIGASLARGDYNLGRIASSLEFVKIWIRIVESKAAEQTLEGIRASVAVSSWDNAAHGTGLAYPAVVVYDVGTATVLSNNVTGYGTKWSDFGVSETVFRDAALISPPTGNSSHGNPGALTSDTSLTGCHLADQATKSRFSITRRLPFTDAAAHKGSLWGTGVKQHPSRVYVGPPGWNLAFPPGAVLPFDPSVNNSNASRNYFLLTTIDVPSPFDADPIVAILSSPGPLWVLKRNSVHAIDGSYLDLSQRVLYAGIGCVDLRSAISVPEGLVFCGEDGIYWSPDGQNIMDLTEGKMNREWRALTRAAGTTFGSTSYVTCGVANGHLVVSGSFGGTARSYLYDFARQEWMGRLSNLTARHMFSARISGEIEALYFVDDAEQGRVMNFAPAINTSGIAKDGDGTSPALTVHTASNFSPELADESRLLDVEVMANVYDSGAAGATQLDMTLEHSGGLLSGGTGVQTKTLTSIDSDSVDLLDRHKREVNRSGRLHQLKLAVSPTGTNDANTKVEISEIALNFREGRTRA